ncbi:MAG: lipoyl synthase [Candidatus Krumholzibacteria bacterium]|nr:lipoyl synthase [Candidatus Krumholzibacteria bacterium]
MKNDGLIPGLASADPPLRKPKWLRMKRQGGEDYNDVKRLLRSASLNTVCESANCPNMGECFNSRTATFMLLGEVCTRHCTFCNIPGGRVAAIDPDEPRRVAEAVRELALKFAVVTSVNRDDLPDGGAAHFASTIRRIRRLNPGCGVEVLIPDFLGDPVALETVLTAAPEVLNHNLETVPRLYNDMRPQADYRRSLQVLKRSRQWADSFDADIRVKTGIMVGVGETRDEVVDLMKDAADHGVRIMTIGQYLQPSLKHHPVLRYVEPAEFDELAVVGRELGIEWVESGPMVRSSYHAREQSAALASSLSREL